MNEDKWEAEMSHLSDDDIIIDASFDEVMAMVDTCFEDIGIDTLVDEQLQFLKLQLDEASEQKSEVERVMEETQEMVEGFRNGSRDDQDASSSGSYEVHEIESGSDDDDDDVKFVEATYDPNSRMSSQSGNFASFQVGGGAFRSLSALTSSTPVVTNQSSPWQPQQPRSVLEVQPKPIPIVVGMKVFAKRNATETWHLATVTEILPGDRMRYKIKFDGRGMKTVDAKALATVESPTESLLVGTRVVSVFHFEDGTIEYYSGMIAEPPNNRNNSRYLMFYDDGYAQYSKPADVYRICEQSRNVWEDTNDDCRDFFRTYLEQYPERPMVRMVTGQNIKTELKGKWWLARVHEVDCSLVQLYFDCERRFEWIYRGSTRLEPLFTQLANAEAARQSGRGGRKYGGPSVQGKKKPIVEYTRLPDDGADKTRPTARKSTGPKLTPAEAAQRKSIFQASSISRSTVKQDAAAILQEKIVASAAGLDEEQLGERMMIDNVAPTDKQRVTYKTHLCCSLACVSGEAGMCDLSRHKGNNPLLIPLIMKWERQFVKHQRHSKAVFYKAPCGRRLRSVEELDKFLLDTNSLLAIDLFSFDADVEISVEYVPVKTFCDIKDVSYGKENVQISCVNGIDRSYPDYVEYSGVRLPGTGVFLNTDPEFLVGCDCTDGCRDPSKCSCIQLTVDAQRALPPNCYDPEAGYKFRRLKQQRPAGIYECNSRCKCDSRCHNRVVQHGLRLRLQVFKTEKKGWGIRCLDDIPAGGFVCIYAGQLLTEQLANEDGKNYGDEFLADLDCMEMAERMKEGYESDVPSDSDSRSFSDGGETSDSAVDAGQEDDSQDSDYAVTFKKKRKQSVTKTELKTVENKPKLQPGKSTGNNDRLSKSSSTLQVQGQQLAAESGDAIVISDNSDDNSDDLPDLDDNASFDSARKSSGESAGSNKAKALIASLDASIGLLEAAAPALAAAAESDTKLGTRTTARRHFGAGLPKKDKDKLKPKEKYVPTRSFFGEDFFYVMDAKSIGNIGRYLNHSCSPNCFVQNVFVDTHDLRFPWVAFFTHQYVRAGTELTWDYNYEVGSVPGKSLNCYCGTESCRGRLL